MADDAHITWSAELRYHGEWGVECAIYRNGEFARSRRFDQRKLAVQWGDEERPRQMPFSASATPATTP
jgi:hypothetical protein